MILVLREVILYLEHVEEHTQIPPTAEGGASIADTEYPWVVLQKSIMLQT